MTLSLAHVSVPLSLRKRLFAAGLALVAMMLAGGMAQQARAQSTDGCTQLQYYSGQAFPGGLAFVGELFYKGDVISGTLTGGESIRLGLNGADVASYSYPSTTSFSYTVPTTGQFYYFASTTAYTIGCAPVQSDFTVNSNADVASGTRAYCLSGSTTACTLRDALAATAYLNGGGIYFDPSVFKATNTTAQNTITTKYGTFSVTNGTTIGGLTASVSQPLLSGSTRSINLITLSGNNANTVLSIAAPANSTYFASTAINNVTITGGKGNQGGGIYNQGVLSLSYDTIQGNTAVNGGGVLSDLTTGTTSLSVGFCTISNNTATNYGGGVFAIGEYAYLYADTITGNTAATGGGIFAGLTYNYYSPGALELDFSTVTGNSATSSGGGINFVNNGSDAFYLEGSVVAGNSAPSAPDIAGGPYTAAYANLAPASNSTAAAPVPNLAPLGDYGGYTYTMPALPGGNASCGMTSFNTFEQRGFPGATTYGGTSCRDFGATNGTYSLVFSTQPAASYAPGVNFGTAGPVVSFADNGYVLPSASTIAFTDAANKLTGTTSVALSSGAAKLSAANIPVTETSDTLTAKDTITFPNAGAQTFSVTSNSFAVVSPVVGFTIAPLTSPITAGTAQSVKVTALSSLSPATTATTYTGTIAFTSTDSAAGLPANYTFVAGDNGVHTFTNGLTFKTSGSQTVTVKDSVNNVSATSGSVTVTAAAASTIVVSSGTSQTAVIGHAFPNPLLVQVTDAYSNPVSGNTVTFTTPALTGASSSLSATTCATQATSPVGTCSVTATADGYKGGPYNVGASAAGVSAGVNFALTNSAASPTLTVTASPTTLVYGQPVTLTSTSSLPSVGPSGNTTSPSGAVTFYDNTTTLTPTSTPTAGVATFSTTALVGAQVYGASQAADANFNAVAKTTATSITVGKASSTLTGPVTQPVTVVYGNATTITINVAGQYSGTGIATPGGSIGYTLNGTSSTAPITAGVATIPVPNTLGVKSYNVAVTYAGDGNYAAATGINVFLQVTPAAQTINFTAPATPVTFGASPVTLVATGGASGNPVTFSIVSGSAFGTLSGTNNSTLTYTGAGTIVIAANQAASTNYAAATQVTQTVVVNPASQTITFAPASPVTFGVAPITLVATGGASGNPVTFSIVSGAAFGTLSGANNATLTITGAGTIVIAADQAASANYSAATEVQKSIVVNPASQSIAFVLASPVTYSATPIALTATGGGSGNPVTFSIVSGAAFGTLSGTNNATLTLTGAGTIVIAANQAGNANYSAATQVTQTLVVNPAPQTISFVMTSPIAFTVSPISLSATGGGSGNPVTFSVVSGGNVGTLSGANNSVLTLTGVGTIVIAANQAGNATYSAATQVTQTVTVTVATTNVAVQVGSPIVYGTSLATLSATASSNGTVVPGSFSYTATLSGGATVAVTSASILPVGTYTITANFTPTNGQTFTTGSATATLVVTKATPSISLAVSAPSVYFMNAATLTATMSAAYGVPTGTVTFLDGLTNTVIDTGKLVNGVATINTSTLIAGDHTLTAVYSGDNNFVGVASAPVPLSVQDFSVHSGGSVTATRGGSTTATVTVTPVGGATFAGDITFTVTGLPAGVTATVSPMVLPGGSAASNVTVTINVASSFARWEQRHGMDPRVNDVAPVALALLLLPFLGRMRKKARQFVLLALLALGAVGGLTGCSGGFGEPVTLTVMGTSGALVHSTTVLVSVK